MELIKLLEELEDIVEDSSTMPFSSKIIVDKTDILDVIKDIRLQIPKQIKQAQMINTDKERIIEQANIEAKEIINKADLYAKERISDNEIVRRAKKESEEIINRANEVSNQIRQGSNEYADEILKQVQGSLEGSLKIIMSNREELQKMN
ncbi:hypothetical protein WG909_14775 [Peptostreptococcaceae bacterium AGR-M142]